MVTTTKIFGIGSVLTVDGEQWKCVGFSFSGLNGWGCTMQNGHEETILPLEEMEVLIVTNG